MVNKLRWMRKIIAVMTVTVLTCSVCACSQGSSGKVSDNKSYKDTINIAVSQEASTLDLVKSSNLIAKYIASGTIFEKLFTLNEKGEPIPELCDTYEVNKDCSEYIIHLRKGVKFHDGSEMTADDVMTSMNRWIENYSNAKDLCGNSRFSKVDDYTVKIALATPCATFLTAIAGSNAIITTKKACAEVDKSGNMAKYIGTGPYKFAEWKLNQYMRLEKFSDYKPYGNPDKELDGLAGYKHAYTDKLIYWYVSEEATRLAGLQTGQYDLMIGLSSDNYDMIKSTDGCVTNKTQGGMVSIICNRKKGIMANRKFRQACNAAMNCEEILKAGYGDFFTLGSCYMDDAQATWVTNAGAAGYNVNNLEKAKALLKESGYKGEPVRMVITNVEGFSKCAEIFKQQMKAIGVNVQFNMVDAATQSAITNDANAWDLTIVSFATSPLPTQKIFLSRTYRASDSDPQMIEYLKAFNTAKSIDDAKAAWVKMQTYCLEDYIPVMMLGHYTTAIGYRKQLEGIKYYNGGVYYWNARVAK